MGRRLRQHHAAFLAAVVTIVAFKPATFAQAQDTLPTDPATNLVMAEHWQVVAAHCGACHSTRLVVQNRGSRAHWAHLIEWMQETQGLWPFNEATETLLLDYLSTYYGPLPRSRRAPLPAALRPPTAPEPQAETGD